VISKAKNIKPMPYNPEIHHRRSIRLKGYDYSQEGLYFITICVQDRESLFGEIVVGASLRGCPESDNNGCTESDINGFPESDNNGCSESDINGCPESNINGCKQMILNDAGQMVERWYRELENKYPDKRCHEMVIMPNHFHCIIENMGAGSQTDNGLQFDDGLQTDNGMELGGSNLGAHVGAPLRGRPINERWQSINDDEHGQPIIYENGFPINIECGKQNDINRGLSNDEKYGLHNKKYNVTIGALVDWFKTMTTNEYMRGVKYYGWKQFDRKLWQRNYYEHIIRSIEEYQRIADYITDNPVKWKEDKFFK